MEIIYAWLQRNKTQDIFIKKSEECFVFYEFGKYKISCINFFKIDDWSIYIPVGR